MANVTLPPPKLMTAQYIEPNSGASVTMRMPTFLQPPVYLDLPWISDDFEVKKFRLVKIDYDGEKVQGAMPPWTPPTDPVSNPARYTS